MHRDKEAEAARRFTDCLRRAVARELSASELIAAAEEISAGGERDLVPQLYQAWLARHPDDALRHALQFNLAVALGEAGDFAGARDAFVEAIRSNPDFLPPYINLGVLLERGGHLEQAVTSWMSAVNRLPTVTGDAVTHKATALKQLGRVFENAQDAPAAEDFLHKSLDINPHQRDVAQHWIALRQAQCRWPVVAGWGGVTRKLLLEAISPLSLAVHSDDPIFQLGNAHRYYRMEVAPAGITTAGAWPPPEQGEAPRRLRIGYVSSDLREHAVGFLTAELFELHDKTRVEVFAYYCGTPPRDALSDRIEAAVDCWTDISAMSDTDAAARIVADRIDILVDLNGYTKDARPKLFALRPAPVIVNWLGYPGTVGSPHHHYIIADDFIIPPELEHFHSEKVLRLPCYQPNDRRRRVAEVRPSRAEAGLPEDAFVYCCFNGTQKISRFTFARWMEILRRVENSVLWLLSGGAAAEAALRRHAEAHGIAPERLVFAAKNTNPEHLARIGLADLFLDTAPYGAHTTASDALWMGVPVLTSAGRSFASRVCGSLVCAAGLPELVCESLDDYVARAVELGRDHAALAALREKLAAVRESCTLFDTPRLARRLEALYETMWGDYVADRLPVPDLANLDLYAEIGVALDDEAVDLQAVTDYEERYRQEFAYRDRTSPVPRDARVWDGAEPEPAARPRGLAYAGATG